MANRYGAGLGLRDKHQLLQAYLSNQGGGGGGYTRAADSIVRGLMYRQMRKEAETDAARNEQAQQGIARALMGGGNPQNVEAAMFNQQNPGELGMVQTSPQKLPDTQQALQQAMMNPQALAQNPMLAQVLQSQMAPPEAYTLAPGAVRMQGGRQVASNPAATKDPTIVEQVRAAGYDPATPEGQKFAREILMKPSVQVTNEYGSIPPGFKRVKDPNSPSGTRLVKEEGGPSDKVPAETAAKLGMLDAAEKSLQEAEGVLFMDGKYDRGVLTSLYSPVRTGKGAQFYNSMRDAVSNRLRAESGASITEEDINDATERFVPKPWDSKEEAEARMRRFRQFLSSYRGAVGAQSNRVKFEELPDG